MVSFEDVYQVDIDEDSGTFTIIRNSGKAQTYDIDAEDVLLVRIFNYSDQVEIYSVYSKHEG